MIKKIKHPKGRGERLAIKAKKTKPYKGSAVAKLLEEKELLDEAGSGLPRDRTDAFTSERS